MRSVKHQHAAIIFFLTLPCQQLSDLQAERSFKKQILMMLPTVTTASEIGINLAQFGNSGQQPLLAPDTPNRRCPPSLPGSLQLPENDPPVWARGRAATAPSPASRQISPSIISFIEFGLFGCRMPGIYFCCIHFICGMCAQEKRGSNMLVSPQLQLSSLMVQINTSVRGCHNQSGMVEQFCKCNSGKKSKTKNLTTVIFLLQLSRMFIKAT